MTTLLSYFGNIKLTQDQNNALTKLESFLESDKKIFVLGGYAGTGKTTILRGVVNYLSDEEHKKNVVLTAPTGRATKVLSSRTGYDAFTIHRTIYDIVRYCHFSHKHLLRLYLCILLRL